MSEPPQPPPPEAASSSVEPGDGVQRQPEMKHGRCDAAFVEPEKKRARLAPDAAECAVKNKLEDRLGGILCCVVCLDLPNAAVYQVWGVKSEVLLG